VVDARTSTASFADLPFSALIVTQQRINPQITQITQITV
jgi:hypothetical protein